MTFLLDTDTVSLALRGKAPRAVERLLRTPREELVISFITAMELHYGLSKNPGTRSRAAVEAFLEAAVVEPLPKNIPRTYGAVRAELERRGVPIGALDTIIAAHAVAAGHTLVTHNTREFRRVRGLRCVDWTL